MPHTNNGHKPGLPLVAELVDRLRQAQKFIASCGGHSAKRLLKKIRATLKRAREEIRNA